MKFFQQLIVSIEQTHRYIQGRMIHAVNQALTIRNWLIGYYITEFEQNWEDRVEYGEKLIPDSTEHLSGIKGIDQRSLFRFREFYLLYPHLIEYVIETNWVTSLKSNTLKNKGTPFPQLGHELLVPPEKIISTMNSKDFDNCEQI